VSKILVPMAGKKGPIHTGHVELIKYAQSLGEVTVQISPKFLSWAHRLITGVQTEESEDLTEMINSIENLGVQVEVTRLPTIPERRRLIELEIAKKWVEIYRPSLISDRYCHFALSALMGIVLKGKTKSCDKAVRGPDTIGFFLKSISKLFGWPERVIMPNMVKDPVTKIRCQGTVVKLPSKFHKELPNLRAVAEEAKPKMRKGRNNKLVGNLNKSLKDKEWKVHEAIIFEGGIFEGKIEVVSFSFPFGEKGTMIIEEIDYYP